MEPFLFQLSGDPGEEALDLLLLFISVGEDEVVRADPRHFCPPFRRNPRRRKRNALC